MGNDEARDEKSSFGNGEFFKSPNKMRSVIHKGLRVFFAMHQSKLKLIGLKR